MCVLCLNIGINFGVVRVYQNIQNKNKNGGDGLRLQVAVCFDISVSVYFCTVVLDSISETMEWLTNTNTGISCKENVEVLPRLGKGENKTLTGSQCRRIELTTSFNSGH